LTSLEATLGGKVLMMMRQDQAPGSNATGDAGKAIIHARLGISTVARRFGLRPAVLFDDGRDLLRELRACSRIRGLLYRYPLPPHGDVVRNGDRGRHTEPIL